jgi:hypothetical protein
MSLGIFMRVTSFGCTRIGVELLQLNSFTPIVLQPTDKAQAIYQVLFV